MLELRDVLLDLVEPATDVHQHDWLIKNACFTPRQKLGELLECPQATRQDYECIRVIEDIPEFIGTNEKKYNLRKNDILSLPDDMFEMLNRRGVVRKINN